MAEEKNLPNEEEQVSTEAAKKAAGETAAKSAGKAAGKTAEELAKALIRQKIIIGSLAGVIALGGAGAAIGYNQGWFGNKPASSQITESITDASTEKQQPASADVDPNAGEWDGTVPQAPKGDPNADSIAIPGYPQIYLPAGKTEVDVAFSNPEGNPCYFTFELVLKDTEEVLYTSKQVPPGEAITHITLNRALDAGEYPAVLKISTFHIVTQSGMNGANVETTLEVK